MATLLAKKSGALDNVIATDDEHHELMANDPTIPQISPGSSFVRPSFQNAAINNFSTVPNASMQQPVLTNAGSNSAQDAEVLVANTNSDWINKKWRPAMGWMYMLTCTCDFVLFPILWSILQALSKGQVTVQWQPVTLQGAGLYHIAMGAVLGIAAYGRTKEKLEGAAK